MASPEVIDVDADEPPRIAGGTGKPDAPLEIASSDSEDEKPRAKRAKPAPATVTPPSPAGPPSPIRALPYADARIPPYAPHAGAYLVFF